MTYKGSDIMNEEKFIESIRNSIKKYESDSYLPCEHPKGSKKVSQKRFYGVIL